MSAPFMYVKPQNLLVRADFSTDLEVQISALAPVLELWPLITLQSL